MTGKRRYYVDFDHGSVPLILPVEPGDEDYDYAEPTLTAAKKKAIDGMKGTINDLRARIKEVRHTRVSDLA